MSSDRETQILDYAEREMRKGGLDSVSFRDIAGAIGIKSASVHYHFPTKADLAERVTRRYADRFIDALGAPNEPAESPQERLTRLIDAYASAFALEGSTCLCTVLGSVATYVPIGTSEEIRKFYNRLSEWIGIALQGHERGLTSQIVISTLQGALALAVATENDKPLRDARDHLLSTN